MSKQRSCAELCEAVGLYIDKCDISRCKGRIGNVKLPSETVEPVLLPTRHHLTTLVINEVHAKVMDGGVGLTLTSIRDNYCIPRVREVVKSFIRRCVVCTKYSVNLSPGFKNEFYPLQRGFQSFVNFAWISRGFRVNTNKC